MPDNEIHPAMPEAQLKAFLEAIKTDPELQAKLKDASDPSTVKAIANEAGFPITIETLENAHTELSDGDLEIVAGGGGCWLWETFTLPETGFWRCV